MNHFTDQDLAGRATRENSTGQIFFFVFCFKGHQTLLNENESKLDLQNMK